MASMAVAGKGPGEVTPREEEGRSPGKFMGFNEFGEDVVFIGGASTDTLSAPSRRDWCPEDVFRSDVESSEGCAKTSKRFTVMTRLSRC